MVFKEFKETDMYKNAKQHIEVCVNGVESEISDDMNDFMVVGTGHMANGDLLVDLVTL